MNKLSVFVGNNTYLVLEECLKSLKQNYLDFSRENIVIVPDRLSLLTEQQIFEVLGIDVYFNISVMGISKFASKIISENCLNFLECSNLSSKLLCLRAIQNTKNNFKCFSKNYTLGLVDEIYAKIEQIKSSNANIEDLIDDNASIGTKLKFEDLKLIYNEYEKLRSNKLDSGALLSLFNNTCASSQTLKNSNVYFVGFDSMTKQGIEVLANVVKTSVNTYIGVVAPHKQNNNHIYDQTFLTSILNLCKQEEFEQDIKWLETNLKNSQADIILKNIFSRKNKFNVDNFLTIYKAITPSDEIDFVVKSINYNLKTKNLKFKDFAICAPQEYHDILISQLSKLNILVHSDSKYPLCNLEPIQYILHILKHYTDPYDKNNVKQILFNSFCPLNQEQKEILLNLINQYSSISTIKNLEGIDAELVDFLNSLSSIKITQNSSDFYVDLIENIIKQNNLTEKINLLCNQFESLGEINLQKIYLQIQERLELILQEIKGSLQNENLNLMEFYDIFEKATKDSEISGVPAQINQVFIGDTKSFFGNVKYLYVLSANEGSFPLVLSDTGLISDKEITSQTIKAKLEPTTKVINKRNKFKVLETILCASEKCYMLYHSISKDGKNSQASDFVTELVNIFNVKELDTAVFKYYNPSQVEIDKLLFNTQDTYNANLNLRNQINGQNPIVIDALIKNNTLFFKPLKTEKKVNYSGLFFPKAKASISIVEKYNSCPHAAFLANALKLKKTKQDKIEANTIGSFIHEVAEIFVKRNKSILGNMEQEQIESFATQICNEIIVKDDYYSIAGKEHLFIFNQIKKECARLCKFLNHEQAISQFKPVYTEKYFGPKSDYTPLKLNVNNKEYYITGIVDRIDTYDDYFRIIDYKSGNTSNAKGKEYLYYGTKIQLFVYSEAIRNNIGKKLFGSFYLPIKNTFTDVGQEDYSLSGFFESSVALVHKCDSTLNPENRKSKLLNCSINAPNKDGEILLAKKNNILSSEELSSYCDYAVKMVEKTIQNIEDGYIDCSPISGKCTFCEFNKFCKNAGNKQIEREEEYEVSKENFLEITNGK